MANYYFTYWICEHGKNNFKQLSDKVTSKVKVPEEIRKTMNIDEYLFHYFFAVYYIVALNYFGLKVKQIEFMLDLALAPGTCKLFPPKEILEVQEENISDIEKYIINDLKENYS